MTDLTERYGARPGRSIDDSTSNRWWWLGVVGLVIGVIVFWALTSLTPDATIETQTARFGVESDTHVTVESRVSVQPGTPLACAVEAQNDRNTVVGWKVVELPASAKAHQVVRVDLETTQRATLVQMRECWVID